VGLRPHVQRGGAGLHATSDQATDGRALECEVLVYGAGPGAEGSAGADAIHADAAGGELGVRGPCHAGECSRLPRLG
jgi:hypothetical protein